MPSSVTIENIHAARTRTIRHEVLRSGLPFETTLWNGDEHPETIHLGAFLDGQLAGVVSLYPAAPPGGVQGAAWQLRGMAVLEAVRGRGIGTRLVEESIARAREAGASVLWCNARASAKAFYARFGFQVQGEAFDLPDIGSHYRMLCDLTGQP